MNLFLEYYVTWPNVWGVMSLIKLSHYSYSGLTLYFKIYKTSIDRETKEEWRNQVCTVRGWFKFFTYLHIARCFICLTDWFQSVRRLDASTEQSCSFFLLCCFVQYLKLVMCGYVRFDYSGITNWGGAEDIIAAQFPERLLKILELW